MDALRNLTDPTTLEGTIEPLESQLQAGESSPVKDNPSLLELGIWQLALRSFFNLRNHPLSEGERAEITARDFSAELKIVQQALRRCLLLCLNYLPEPASSTFEAYEAQTAANFTAGSSGETAPQIDNSSLLNLSQTLSDLCRMSDTWLASEVNFQAWTNCEKIVRQGMEQSPLLRHLERRVRTGMLLRQHPRLHQLTEQIAPDALAADLSAIFTQLAQLLEQLRFIEALLTRDFPLKQTLPIFTLVHEETRALVEFIEKRALRAEEIGGEIFDVLDSTSYALAAESSKVFGRELIDLASLRQPPAIYIKVENAHGLLRDSFQQTIVALAQVLDPSLDGAQLFQSFHSKLEQSLRLRHDLWMLLQRVLRAEQDRDLRPLTPLLESLNSFRQGSLRFLMYKDWEAFERFAAEVEAARGTVGLTPVLHRFGTYLEALFGQINMRNVLADQPFNYPTFIE